MIGAMQVSMAGAQGTWRGGSDGAGEVWGQIMKDLERWDNEFRLYVLDHWRGFEAGITWAVITKKGLEKEEFEARR